MTGAGLTRISTRSAFSWLHGYNGRSMQALGIDLKLPKFTKGFTPKLLHPSWCCTQVVAITQVVAFIVVKSEHLRESSRGVVWMRVNPSCCIYLSQTKFVLNLPHAGEGHKRKVAF